MKKYFRVMLGAKSVHAEQCHAEGFIGTDFLIAEDLTRRLPDDFRAFNNEFIPIYLRNRPDKTRIGAGLSCGALWTVSKGIKERRCRLVSPMVLGAIKPQKWPVTISFKLEQFCPTDARFAG